MNFIRLIPNVFYTDIKTGLKTFVECLEFKIVHDEINSVRPFCVVERDGLRANLFQDTKYAQEHNPEFRLETKNIEEVYERISSKFPEMLHPNLPAVTLRPWGAKEFALVDGQIGIVVQQWS